MIPVNFDSLDEIAFMTIHHVAIAKDELIVLEC
jgi:hypothetical protein